MNNNNICHEFIGHVPMFADPDFADLSHQVGLASLGATDEEIEKLARCYWYSVEFGLTLENGVRKAYGAGLLSSFGEIEYACSNSRPAGGTSKKPIFYKWDPNIACDIPFPITKYQPIYFVSNNLEHAKNEMQKFCEKIPKKYKRI